MRIRPLWIWAVVIGIFIALSIFAAPHLETLSWLVLGPILAAVVVVWYWVRFRWK